MLQAALHVGMASSFVGCISPQVAFPSCFNSGFCAVDTVHTLDLLTVRRHNIMAEVLEGYKPQPQAV